MRGPLHRHQPQMPEVQLSKDVESGNRHDGVPSFKCGS